MFSVHLVCRCLADSTVIYGVFVQFLILSQMCFLYLMQNRIRESNKHENGKRFQRQLCQCTGSKKCKKSKPGSSKTCTGSKKYKKCKTQMQVRGQGLIGLEFCSFCIFLSLWPALMPLRDQAIEVMSALLINQMLTGRYNSAAVMTHTHNHQPFRITCPNHIKQGLK